MTPTLSSQGLVLATAMAVSAGTVVLIDLLRGKYFPPISQIHQNQLLKSCLSSEDVKEPKGNGELYRKAGSKRSEIQKKSCGNELKKMPANHAALYNGILKQRMGCSY
ncbi:hypothetical protein SASPL_118828 [Salvia splendens]|uniref:Uncharacterized protein n=1 Tax=Salvia splendens TaxID=180675 RepID=A0A8X8ZYS2_SALSN|nr:hypothetical protein SASPL_118828 [Salvia splendens]